MLKNRSCYENCEMLSIHGEIDVNGASRYWVYMDPFGCDLRVYGSNVSNNGLCRKKERIKVFLGGRNVYSFCENQPEKIIHGYWEKLIEALWQYELAVCFDEPCFVDNALAEMCKSESRKNRDFFENICDKCSKIVTGHGEFKRISDKIYQYKLEKEIGGREIVIVMCYAGEFPDSLNIYYNEENVFTFHYNRVGVSSLFRDKGYYFSGEWEKIVDKLYDECIDTAFKNTTNSSY